MSINVYISYDGDAVSHIITQASLADDPDALRRVSQDIEFGNGIFKDWAINNGGSVITQGGDKGKVQIDVEHIKDLPELQYKYSELVGATVSIGVGAKMSEADKALLVAKHAGGDKIQLYTPELEKILAEVAQAREEAVAKREIDLIKSSGHVRSAAFHDLATGQTYETGAFHDLTALPQEIQDKYGSEDIVEGFVTHAGHFIDRETAANLAGVRHGESTELGLNIGRKLGAGETPGGKNLGLRKDQGVDGTSKFSGGQTKSPKPVGAKPSGDSGYQFKLPPKPKVQHASASAPVHSRPFMDEKGNIWFSQKSAAAALGINQGDISGILNGSGKSLGGHTFHYLDDHQVNQVHGKLDEMADGQSKKDGESLSAQTEQAAGDERSSSLKKQVVAVLKVFKSRAKELELLKEKDPELYQTLVKLVKVMTELAKDKFGDGSVEVKKSESPEGTIEETQEESTEETSEISPTLKAAVDPGATGRHERKMPPGTQLDPSGQGDKDDGRVKIQDPQTGASKWRFMRAGKIRSQTDGTATSALRPHPGGGPQPDSGDPAGIAQSS